MSWNKATIILSRLGETKFNLEGKISGAGSDSPLTPRGQSEARLLGERLKKEYEKIDAIYASKLKRTISTAQIVAETLKFKGKIKVSKAFNELNFGKWEGQSIAWINTRYPKYYNKFLKPKDINWRFPNGESWKEAIKRSLPILLEISKTKPSTTLVISHGLLNRLIINILSTYAKLPQLEAMLKELKNDRLSQTNNTLLNKAIANITNIKQTNVCINIIEFYENGDIKIPVINEHSHLGVTELKCPYCSSKMSEKIGVSYEKVKIYQCENYLGCKFSQEWGIPYREIDSVLHKLLKEAQETILNYIEPPSKEAIGEIKKFIKELRNSKKNNGPEIVIGRKLNKDLIGLWAFSYNEFIDALETYDLIYLPLELESEETKRRREKILNVKIKGGAGTVGFIQRSGEPEVLNNTADDSRGSVALEDLLIRNFSWAGIPVKGADGKVELIVSFFLPYYDAWKNLKELKPKLKKIVKKYRDVLLLQKELRKTQKLLELTLARKLVKEETDWREELPTFLKEIQELSYRLLPVSHIFLCEKTNSNANEYSLNQKDYLLLDYSYLAVKFHKEMNWCSAQGKLCDTCKKILAESEFKEGGGKNGVINKCIVNHLFKVLEAYCCVDLFNRNPYTMRLVVKDKNKFDCSALRDSINSYFEALVDKWEKTTDLIDKKVKSDAIVHLAKLIFKVILGWESGEEEEIKKDAEQIEKVAFNINESKFGELVKNLKNSFKNIKNNILLCLLIKSTPGLFNLKTSENDIIEAVKEPATINVLFRAMEDTGKGELKKYKTYLEVVKKAKLAFNETKNSNIEVKIGNKVIGTLLPGLKRNSVECIEFNPPAITEVIFNKMDPRTKTFQVKGSDFVNQPIPKLNEILECSSTYVYPIEIFAHDMALFTTFRMEEAKIKDSPAHNTFKDFIENLEEILRAKIERLEIKRHALRSAVAAILTESYAHNIGAHGLEGLKIKILEEWENIRTETLLLGENQSILKLCTNLMEKSGLDDRIKGMIKTHSCFIEFLKYLQGKSAFWSAISRGGALFGGTVTNLWQLINDFGKNNLLCGALGASEGYKGIKFSVKYDDKNKIDLGASTIEDDLRFRFEEEDLAGACEEAYQKRIERKVEGGVRDFDPWETLKKELEETKIFLPEGLVGQQAVYTIWENIIRNVKHCKKPTGSNPLIPFYIEFKEKGDFIEITNWIDIDPEKPPDELRNSVERMNNWSDVLDKNGKPNMGGTTQSILCAGIVLGLDYMKTEELQKNKDDEKKVMRFSLDGNRIKSTFKIWKGKDIGKWTDIANKNPEEIGPLGRFGIIQLNNDNEKNNLLNNPFLLRHIISESEKEFCELYEKWVKEWILNNNNKEKKIKIQEKIGYFVNYNREENSSLKEFDYHFYHREPDSSKSVRIAYKTNDAIGKIIEKIPVDFPKEEDKKQAEKIALLELLEILETSIEIYDDRINNRNEKLTSEPKLASFKVEVFPEDEKKLPKKNEKSRFHLGVFHLSFLERITGKNNEKAIEQFLTNYGYLLARYKFLIITTGRGRDWWNGLKDDYKKRIKFVPIENLERCFDDGIYLVPKTPAIGVKYALVRTIFGR